MSHTPVHESLQSANPGDDRSVYQCPHRCLHVRLNNLTLTFTVARFQHLTPLLTDASARLACSPLSRVAVH
jgi:hypothetical protein